MVVFQSTETRNIALKKPGPFEAQISQFLQYQSDFEIWQRTMLSSFNLNAVYKILNKVALAGS